jgi:lipopolysaccharide/colanic/teichoic acid biosynthesis glycosyltransferase
MLSTTDKFQKRFFDIILSVVGICLTWWIMLLAWIIASAETKSNGLFIQERIGKEGKPFLMIVALRKAGPSFVKPRLMSFLNSLMYSLAV